MPFSDKDSAPWEQFPAWTGFMAHHRQESVMADDKSKIGKQDRDGVAANQHHEVTVLADKFEISMEQARDLIERYGNNRAILEQEARKLQGPAY